MTCRVEGSCGSVGVFADSSNTWTFDCTSRSSKPRRTAVHDPPDPVARSPAFSAPAPCRLVLFCRTVASKQSAGERSNQAHIPTCSGPLPQLPAQALDHGVGYLLAAAVCRALVVRERDGIATTIHGALIGAANHLFEGEMHGEDELVAPPRWTKDRFESIHTPWGDAIRARAPGRRYRGPSGSSQTTRR